MDEHTRHNWQKIKQMLEQTGKTDCFFYKRACALLQGKPDPLK
jgi:hypothetical protein